EEERTAAAIGFARIAMAVRAEHVTQRGRDAELRLRDALRNAGCAGRKEHGGKVAQLAGHVVEGGGACRHQRVEIVSLASARDQAGLQKREFVTDLGEIGPSCLIGYQRL